LSPGVYQQTVFVVYMWYCYCNPTALHNLRWRR